MEVNLNTRMLEDVAIPKVCIKTSNLNNTLFVSDVIQKMREAEVHAKSRGWTNIRIYIDCESHIGLSGDRRMTDEEVNKYTREEEKRQENIKRNILERERGERQQLKKLQKKYGVR